MPSIRTFVLNNVFLYYIFLLWNYYGHFTLLLWTFHLLMRTSGFVMISFYFGNLVDISYFDADFLSIYFVVWISVLHQECYVLIHLDCFHVFISMYGTVSCFYFYQLYLECDLTWVQIALSREPRYSFRVWTRACKVILLFYYSRIA